MTELNDFLASGIKKLAAALDAADREANFCKAKAIKAMATEWIAAADRVLAGEDAAPPPVPEAKAKTLVTTASTELSKIKQALGKRKMRLSELEATVGGSLPEDIEQRLTEAGYVCNRGWWGSVSDAGLDAAAMEIVAAKFSSDEINFVHKGELYDALRDHAPAGYVSEYGDSWEREQVRRLISLGVLKNRQAWVGKGQNFEALKPYQPRMLTAK